MLLDTLIFSVVAQAQKRYIKTWVLGKSFLIAQKPNPANQLID